MQAAQPCRIDVDRGPEWIFIRPMLPVVGSQPEVALANSVWEVIEQHRVYRVVLELDQVQLLYSMLIGQLVLLQKRIHTAGGVLRLCGLSETNECVLRTAMLDSRLPNYANRHDAVMGHRPQKAK